MEKDIEVLLVDQDRGRAAILKEALSAAGYRVVGTVTVDGQLAEAVAMLEPDVIVIDMESPDRDTLECMRVINAKRPKPVVMFADDGDRQTIEAAVRAGVSAYVVDGLAPQRIRPIVEVAIARFREFQALRSALEKSQNDLAERKEIDKAKGLLMKQRGWDEETAYGTMRRMAMDQNRRLVEVARMIISVGEILKG